MSWRQRDFCQTIAGAWLTLVEAERAGQGDQPFPARVMPAVPPCAFAAESR